MGPGIYHGTVCTPRSAKTPLSQAKRRSGRAKLCLYPFAQTKTTTLHYDRPSISHLKNIIHPDSLSSHLHLLQAEEHTLEIEKIRPKGATYGRSTIKPMVNTVYHH